MKVINDPYLTIVNARTKYDDKIFSTLKYETVPVTDGDWGKKTAKIEKNTKCAYDNVLKDFEKYGIECKLMSAKRSQFDQIYAQAETFAIKLNDDAKNILKSNNDSTSKGKRFVTVLKNPKLIKLAYQHQKTFAARLGHSEHHTGLAIDIKVNMDNVQIPEHIRERYPDATPNALNFITRRLIMEKHGFILTYPQSPRLEEATGMLKPEGWHWRYVGAEHSQMIAKIREKVSNDLNTKHEVFLEDYVNLLSRDVKAHNERELLEQYSEIFKTNILGIKQENVLSN